VSDLNAIVVINDNKSFEAPGDIMVYPSKESASLNMETLDLRSGQLHALSAAGHRLHLSEIGERVCVFDANDGVDHSKTLKAWLLYHTANIARARAAIQKSKRAQNADAPGANASIESLIRFVGFS
jgi:hypothetical protein